MDTEALKKLRLEAQQLGYTDEREITKYAADRAREIRAEMREKETHERESAAEIARRDHEYRMAQLEVQRQTQLSTVPQPVKIKIPMFPDDGSLAESYFVMFERVATDNAWNDKTKLLQLVTHLAGYSLEIYHRTDVGSDLTYKDLKGALLDAFAITIEEARVRFLDAKLEENETCKVFATRLKHYLDRWFRLSTLPNTKEGVIDLILTSQLMESLPKGLRAHLRMSKVVGLSESVEKSDAWFAAYGYHSKVLKDGSQRSGQGGQFTKPNRTEANPKSDAAQSMKSFPNQPKNNNFSVPYKSSKQRMQQLTNTAVVTAEAETDPKANSEDTDHVLCICLSINALESSATSPTPKGKLPTEEGQVQGKKAIIMRDTGSTGCVVDSCFVCDEDFTGRNLCVIMVDRSRIICREAWVFCQSPYYAGWVTAAVMDHPTQDFILGNVPGAKQFPSAEAQTQTEEVHINYGNKVEDGSVIGPIGEAIAEQNVTAVSTRASSRKGNLQATIGSPNELGLLLNTNDIVNQQKTDPTLSKVRDLATSQNIRDHKGIRTKFLWLNERLYRHVTYPDGEVRTQFVVPQDCRQQVFHISHSVLMGGHMGIKKTLARMEPWVFWPGMAAQVTRMVRSCDICQKTADKGRATAAPLHPLPIISEPFSRVAVDIVGPIVPCSSDRSKYILTIVDFATRWPEAVPLRDIEAQTVVEALFQVMCRIGIPREVLSDRGSQFTSGMMEDTWKLLSVKGMKTTAYHPECNGLCEKFNGTLKRMLKRMTAEQPKEWPRYLAPLLFAYRETPQCSLGYSPFELVYGRLARGPLQVLRELWDGDREEPAATSIYQYVLDLGERLQATCDLAKEELLKSRITQKKYYDRKARLRVLQEGDQCLLLLPTSANKLLAQWKGPYKVVRRHSNVNYVVKVGNEEKKFHINMLKKYYSPEHETKVEHYSCTTTIVYEDSSTCQPITPQIKLTEGVSDVLINPQLEEEIKRQLQDIISNHWMIFSDVSRAAKLDEYKIVLRDNDPVRTKPYPIPLQYMDAVIEETRKLEEAGIIEMSNSPYCSPIVVVKKKSGEIRMCGDYRRVNSVVEFDAEPMSDQKVIFSRLSASRFFTKMDLLKGFFQIPLHPESRKITAFKTPIGLYQYRVLPFGLSTSPSVFNRAMRRVLGDIPGVEIFMDDILIHTRTMEEHYELLQCVLQRLKKHDMTVKPSKCEVAFTKTDFLGHTIGGGKCECQQEKIEKIRNAPRPTSLKQVRSFVGLVGYYQSFIPDFAQMCRPLYELMKKNKGARFVWEEEQEAAFEKLKEVLCSSPILKLPSKHKVFTIRTDASEDGLGAILLQEFDGELFPVAYYSRRLTRAERNYSTVEREMLAVMVGIRKFYYYLCGAPFILETDHMPLSQVKQTKTSNARLMRWALYLQQFDFNIRYIRGSENVGADLLSRLRCGEDDQDVESPHPV